MESNLLHTLDSLAEWAGETLVEGNFPQPQAPMAPQGGHPPIVCHVHPREVYFKPIQTTAIEAMLVLRGHVTEIVEQKQVFLQQGDLLLVNLYTDHGVMPLGKEDLAVNFSISPTFLNRTLAGGQNKTLTMNFLSELLSQEQGAGQYLHYRTSGHLPIQNLMELILVQLYPQHTRRVRWTEGETEKIITSAFSMVLLYLSKDLSHLDENAPLNYDQFTMETIRRYLAESYQTASLSELASVLNCSQSTLSRTIKRLTGVAFTELLQGKRFSVACQLLRQSDLPITEIAHSVGYENVSYFYRCFEKQFHITPRQYRDQSPTSITPASASESAS